MAHDVFLSYAARDRGVAQTVCDNLESQQVRCWIAPRDISPGVDWGASIVNAIKSSRVVVVLLSDSANHSAQVVREVEYAVSSGAVVIPYRIDDTRPKDVMEYLLATTQVANSREELALAVRRNLTKHASTDISNVVTVAQDAACQPTMLTRVGRLLVSLVNPSIARDTQQDTVLDSRTAQQPAQELVVAVSEQMVLYRLEDLARFNAPPSLRTALAAVLPDLPMRLDRIARQASQALTVQDPSRKLEITESAVVAIRLLQSELLDQQGPIARELVNGLARWIRLFTRHRDEIQAVIEEIREIENPFIVGNPVNSPDSGLFTGRHDVVLEIERTILRSTQLPTLLLYGQRRMGKTSILYQLPSLLGPGFLPVFVDCQAPATIESQAALIRYLSRCLANALNSRLNILHENEAVHLAHGAVPLVLDALRENPFSVFEDWLDAYQRRLPAETRVLLCLDEFERLQELIATGWGTRFLDALRHWLQHRPSFALLFSGSHTFEQLGPAWTDRFLSARRLKVSFLGTDEARQLLTKPTPTFRLTYADGALNAMLNATHGQPFLTQVLASELVHHMNRERRKEATSADVEAAIEQTLERSADYFADLWFSRTVDEQSLLVKIARGEAAAPTSSVARGLIEYDVLDENAQFAVPMVHRWVRDHRPSE